MRKDAANPDAELVWWAVPWRFLVEAVVNVFVFSVIAGTAAVVNVVVEALAARRVDSLIVAGLRTAEYTLFATDLVLFARFLWKTAARTWEVF